MLRSDKTIKSICVDVEVVANLFQRCLRFGRSAIKTPVVTHLRDAH